MSDDHAGGSTTATTWRHGLIARWWANFNLDGPEIAVFRSFVASGQPALDVGCGSCWCRGWPTASTWTASTRPLT